MFETRSKPRKSTLLLILSGLLFGYLMCVRVGVFSFTHLSRPLTSVHLSEKESWLNIYQDEQKIGYSHRQLSHEDTGYYLSETMHMRLNTMGMVHTLQVRTLASLDAELRLVTVDFSLKSHRFSFNAKGWVENNVLIVAVDGREIRLPLDGPLYVTAAALDATDAAGLKPGEAIDLPVFDPATLGRRTIRVTSLGKESLNIMGRDMTALKLRVDAMGAEMTAWVDENGGILQEKGLLGITLKRVTREAALEGQSLASSRDLTRLVSVSAGRPIEEPEGLSRLELAVGGLSGSLDMDGDRQVFKNHRLSIRREGLADPDRLHVAGMEAFLRSTPFVESDHPELKRLADRIVSGADRPLERARRLVAWVYDNIEKRPVISVPSALETLRHRQGDCNEHAVLLTALARAAGIPAQVESGLVYLKGRFYYHAWNVLYLGQWVTADALMNQLPADVTHLRLVRGDPREQVDLMGAIGNLSLQILETDP